MPQVLDAVSEFVLAAEGRANDCYLPENLSGLSAAYGQLLQESGGEGGTRLWLKRMKKDSEPIDLTDLRFASAVKQVVIVLVQVMS